MSIIEAKNISFHYNGIPVLEDISFSVCEGEYLGIIGPNGGGKTTLLKIMLGLIKPSKGTVKLFGQNINHLKDKARLGYVPQRVTQNNLSFPTTVQEIVASGRTARLGWFKRLAADDKIAITRAMETADILKFRNKLIQELSGGELQRVYIARAMAGEPKILFLDEPTTGVDAASQEKFYAYLESLNKKLGITIVFVSHDIDVVASQVSSVLCLNKRLVCHGPPREYIKESYLKQLYGSKINLVIHGTGHHTH
jgi:zinc transport system ATP-binding protein